MLVAVLCQKVCNSEAEACGSVVATPVWAHRCLDKTCDKTHTASKRKVTNRK